MAVTAPPWPLARRWAATLAIGAAGGAAAVVIGLPLPWLLGALGAVGAAAAAGVRVAGGALAFPNAGRLIMIPVIGVLIGAGFGPEVMAGVGAWAPGLIGVALFVPTALAFNYVLLRRVAGFDKPTAYFAGMPGGLIESIELGSAAGANIRALTVLQFSRIAVTVTALPLLFFALEGRAVGSAAGEALAAPAPLGPADALLLLACGALGFWAGRRWSLPAGQITGPILASALVHAAGLTEASPPAALVALAQLVVGTHLGLRFEGLSPAELRRYLGLSAISVAGMMTIGAGFAASLAALGVGPFAVMILCFAPGGLVEMGLIALSLDASPIFVTAHHFARIVAAVTIAARGWRGLSSR